MTTTQILESMANDGTGLRVSLEWDHDRYRHHIDWVTGDLAVRLLESVEQDQNDLAPNRPVLQQLSIESRGQDSQVALALGMGEQSHWSMSIETAPELRTVIFDIACRLTEPVDNLSSCYQLVAPVGQLEEKRCVLNVVGHPCQLEIDSSARSETLQMQLDDHRLLLIPRAPEDDFPVTLRWRYRVVG